ncbi:hypothetical protein SERLADRAFT_405839 [Serpula lacrymans var. lacrymans S7.9]|uniref:Uncharacterized protein n=1 Tax=Serpula lacrymans var. lacrymans (strain S7.9) TaxID=578457 RepID=F8NLL2_SERL9|nr:uncharacterized protein SERLADRAFT_405839 [Serpula lacrymans var. lacrymans S7.9]EGO28193.1 hypothetical protein SERLADRAFT_405839 [Serpula lacrymans var. lacrymans S7.9]
MFKGILSCLDGLGVLWGEIGVGGKDEDGNSKGVLDRGSVMSGGGASTASRGQMGRGLGDGNGSLATASKTSLAGEGMASFILAISGPGWIALASISLGSLWDTRGGLLEGGRGGEWHAAGRIVQPALFAPLLHALPLQILYTPALDRNYGPVHNGLLNVLVGCVDLFLGGKKHWDGVFGWGGVESVTNCAHGNFEKNACDESWTWYLSNARNVANTNSPVQIQCPGTILSNFNGKGVLAFSVGALFVTEKPKESTETNVFDLDNSIVICKYMPKNVSWMPQIHQDLRGQSYQDLIIAQISIKSGGQRRKQISSQKKTLKVVIQIKEQHSAADIAVWEWLQDLVKYLGEDRRSLEESNVDRDEDGIVQKVYRVKAMFWRKNVEKELGIINKTQLQDDNLYS